MSRLTKDAIRDSIRRNLNVLNRLESHLGCASCRCPLTEGRCPQCQPREVEST